MKKQIITLVIAALIAGSCGVSNGRIITKTMLEEFNLKGKVKSVTYEYEKGKHKLHFDESGRLIKQENFLAENYGSISGSIHDNYLYEEGKLQSFDIIRTFTNRSDLLVGNPSFEYDSSGLLISSDNETYKYDKKGNRIERYGYLKTRQKFNAEGQVTEEWYFEDKETETRSFGITDAEGNHLPDEIHIHPPHESPPIKYEHNEFGDVISVTDTWQRQPVTNTITLVYDDRGNWIERTANSNYHYLTTEQIYTKKSYYGEQYMRRIIEYYE